jgi:hypothetical protein
VLLAHADLAAQLGRSDEAAALLRSVLELRPAGTVDRTARVKLAALQSPASGRAIFDYFRPGRDEGARLLRLREALDREPDNASLSYLLGRRVQAEAPRLAARYLGQALARELPDSLRREALRLKVEALYLAGDCDGVRHEAGQLPDLGAALKARVTEWVERCDFEQRVFQGPLSPEEGFR